jgi:hypothetical protein
MENHTEWIEQYLNGELEGDALNQFNERLQADASFKREVEVQRAIVVQIRQSGRAALRSKLVEVIDQLDLPWPVESYEDNSPTESFPEEPSLPIREQANRWRYYAIAATVTLLLVGSGVGYWLYRSTPVAITKQQSAATDTRQQTESKATTPLPQIASIRLERIGKGRTFGFGGAGSKDTTLSVLLYPAGSGVKAYQFGDTLRLYGNFNLVRLLVQYDQRTKHYTLLEDSIGYPLQRYRPRQALTLAP